MRVFLTERIHLGELCEGGIIAAGTVVVPVQAMHAVKLLTVILEGLEALVITGVSPWTSIGIIIVCLFHSSAAVHHHMIVALIVTRDIVMKRGAADHIC